MAAWTEHLRDLQAAAEVVSTSTLGEGRSAADLVVLMAAGAEVGLAPIEAVAKLAIRGGRIETTAEVLRALARKAGAAVDVAVTGSGTDLEAEVTVHRSDGTGGSARWTMADAARAELTWQRCWRAHPRAMLVARASAEAVRRYTPEVLGALGYTHEEGDEIAQRCVTTAPERPEPADEAAPAQADEESARAPVQGDEVVPAGWSCLQDALAAHRALLGDAEALTENTVLVKRLAEIRRSGELLDRDRFATARRMVDAALVHQASAREALSVIAARSPEIPHDDEASVDPPAPSVATLASRAARLARRMDRGRRCA